MERLLAVFEAMAANKGVGPDDIPAELLRAGSVPLARLASDLGRKIADTECWPIDYKSGRLVDLFKGKGDRKDCDASRGLTLINHISKGLIADVKNEVEPKYTVNMRRSQMGAVQGPAPVGSTWLRGRADHACL